MLFRQDNRMPHICVVAVAKSNELSFKLHPPYSPNFTPSDWLLAWRNGSAGRDSAQQNFIFGRGQKVEETLNEVYVTIWRLY